MTRELEGAGPFEPPADWTPRLKLELSGRSGLTVDEIVNLGVAVVLTEDDYHSVSDERVRSDPDLHEHNLPARVWWTDDQEERTVGGLLAAIRRRSPWQWLVSTYYLQRDTYGYPLDDFAARVRDLQGQSGLQMVAEYIDWNISAAIQELAEARVEFSWKPWATDKPFVNRDRLRDELIDTLHFIGNILVGIDVTDAELAEHYARKQAKNRARQASGNYSAKKGELGDGSDV